MMCQLLLILSYRMSTHEFLQTYPTPSTLLHSWIISDHTPLWSTVSSSRSDILLWTLGRRHLEKYQVYKASAQRSQVYRRGQKRPLLEILENIRNIILLELLENDLNFFDHSTIHSPNTCRRLTLTGTRVTNVNIVPLSSK